MQSVDNFEELTLNLSQIISTNTKEIINHSRIKSGKKPWVDSNVMNLIANRDFFYDLSKKYPHTDFYLRKFNHYKIRTFKEMRKSRRKYFNNQIKNCSNAGKKLWEIINNVVLNKSKGNKIHSIKLNNEVINNTEEITNKFNKYFVSIGQNLSSNFYNTVTDSTDQELYSITNPFELKLTNITEIVNIIKKLNSKSATGYDNISVRFIQKFISELSPIYCKIINLTFSEGVFPNCLKTAVVTPLYKNGCKANIENYRGVSVLSTNSKILEYAMYNRLKSFLSENNIIHKNQFGFVENSSTISATTQLICNIKSALDKKLFVSTVFIDLRKAFDMVNHENLIKKIESIGITNEIHINLFKSYLAERVQKVKIENIYSNNERIDCGVPQGSVLGPLFFNIYANGIFYLNLHGDIQLYADDIAITYQNTKITELYKNMQEDLITINNWLNNNRLLMNLKKTNYIIYKVKHKFRNINLDDFNLKLDSNVIDRVDSVTYLGLIIDENLNWSYHINAIKRKINASTFALRKLNYTLPDNAKWYFFHSCIISHINYLNPIWNCASELQIHSLKVMINKAIKIIKNYPRLHPTNDLYSMNILPIEMLNKFHTIILIYKIKNNYIKNNILLQSFSQVHSHETRRQDYIVTEYSNSSSGQKNILHFGINLFNMLPSSIKNEKTNICVQK